jgi:hypothetical protein
MVYRKGCKKHFGPQGPRIKAILTKLKDKAQHALSTAQHDPLPAMSRGLQLVQRLQDDGSRHAHLRQLARISMGKIQ